MPGASNGAGLSGGRRAWTPKRLGDYFFFLPKVGNTTGLTIVSDKIAAADVGNGATLSQATSSKRPAYDTGTLLNGYPCAQITSADTTELLSATGGITSGDADYTIWWVGTPGTSTTYQSLCVFGAQASGNGCLGLAGTGVGWAGGTGFGDPLITGFGAGAHLFMARKSGGTVEVWCNGERVASNTAVAGRSVNITDARFGIGAAFTASMPNASIHSAGWIKRAITTAEKLRLERWAWQTYAIGPNSNQSYVAFVGDSQSDGYNGTRNGAAENTTSPNNWPNKLTGLAAAVTLVDCATSNWTTTQILANYDATSGAATPTVRRANGMRPNCIAVVWAGTNDLYFGGTAADAWTNLQTICSTLRSTGWKVILVTPLKRTQTGTPTPGYETQRLLLAASILGSVGTYCEATIDAGGYVKFQTTTDKVKFLDDEVHLSIEGENDFADDLAVPAINALGI